MKNKMKTTQKQFELFKKECRKRSDRFELNCWRLDFYLKDISKTKRQALVEIDYASCVVDMNFHIEIIKNRGETWNELIKDLAKHEMLHVLTGNLTELAESRYVTPDELDKAQEELVVKLENIIKC